MTVVKAYVGRKKISPPEDYSHLQTEISSLLHEGIAMNTTGSVFSSKDGEGTEVSGSPTEKVILQWAVKSGMKFDSVKSECTVLHVSPFNSTKKRGGVALRRQTDSQVYIHWKGAAEIVLGCCRRYLNSDGSVQPIDNEVEFYKNAIEDMAAKSLRCVVFAQNHASARGHK